MIKDHVSSSEGRCNTGAETRVEQSTSRLTLLTPGYSMGLKSVRHPEPGLRRVTPLALATRLLGNSQYNPKNSRVAAAVLLNHWFVCKQRIFVSCDVVKGVGYYQEIFMRNIYI